MKVRTDAKRDAILQIASEVFLEMGYERASMAEIAARVGGSKATLYGYFPSKEAIFLTLAQRYGAEHMGPAMEELISSTDNDLPKQLQRFGERLLTFLASGPAMSVTRLVLAESGHSDVGQRFYEAGQKQGMETMSMHLQSLMDRGLLRPANALVAAQHFGALVHAEAQYRWYYREAADLTTKQIKAMVTRAVEVFLRAYGSD